MSYMKVTSGFVQALAAIVGEKNVLTGDERKAYSRDESTGPVAVMPDVVVRPENTEAVSRIMKLANEHGIPVTPRGAGTGLSGGAIPIAGGIVLSLERMNKIIEVDRDNFCATVEPGVTLIQLYKAAGEQGLYYPTYPGETSATIGGNVATNAGGMRAVRYGVTRSFILGLQAVLPTGEVIETGGKFVKNTSGYDLTQLIIGSEGTLAIVTRVLIKLTLIPGKSEILFIPFPTLKDAIEAVPDILKAGVLPVGIEFMEKDIIQMVEKFTGVSIPMHDRNAFLMVMVEAETDEQVQATAEKIGDVCFGHGADDVFLPPNAQAKKELLEAREKFYPTISHFGMLELVDIVVPRSKIAEFVAQSKQIATDMGINLVAYGHAGDGNVHMHPIGERTPEVEAKVHKLLVELYKVGMAMGGAVSGEHGLGIAKRDYFLGVADPARVELMKRIKTAFDPRGILNPGKLFDRPGKAS
jgi:glycolate oxidase